MSVLPDNRTGKKTSRRLSPASALKVAMVEPVGGHGGMAPYDLGLCDGLAASGCDVTLYTCEINPPYASSFTTRTCFSGVYGQAPGWLRGIRFTIATLKIMIEAMRNGVRVFHFHLFQSGIHELLPLLFARLFFARVLVTAHDVEPLEAHLSAPFSVRWSLQLAHAIIAHNASSRNTLIKQHDVHPNDVHIIAHGNYLHCLPPPPGQKQARHALGLKQDVPLLLFFGQIKESKGLDLLLHAMAQVVRIRSDVQLLIAGRPWKNDFSSYMQIIENKGLLQHCYLHIHYIEEEDVPLYYAAASLLVLPYRKIYQSGVLLMAMSMATPLLAADLPGMTDVLGHEEKYGMLFRHDDVDDLSRKILTCLERKEHIMQQAAAAKMRMQEAYNWHHLARQTKALYLKTIQA